MKKINSLVIKSFIGPFILTFFLILFILLMQFVWKYLDDLMGKGIEFNLILELLAYKSTNLVGGALPLAVLLSSIMTMGSLAENYELVALKSSGLSLIKISKGLIILIFSISIGTFLFSNYVTPVANLKFKSLLWDIIHQKPLLEIKEGIFYGELGDFVIRVDEKDENERLYDVLIYDHRPPNVGNGNVIRAKEAEIAKTMSGRHLIFKLYDGVMYREMPDKNRAEKDKNYTHLTTDFEQMTMRMDLSSFEFQETDEERWSNNREMLNMSQLRLTADSLAIMASNRENKMKEYMNNTFWFNKDSGSYEGVEALNFDSAFSSLAVARRNKVIETSRNLKKNIESYLKVGNKEINTRATFVRKYWIEWHRKITLSVACLILFFIGAPLGAIIKKGGLGLPFLISVAIFLVYHITSMSGEKMAKTGVLSAFEGMWLSSFILLPFAIFLSVQATRETALTDKETYINFFKKMFKKS